MAVLAYCLACDKLVPVRPGEYKLGSRERRYYPLEHDAPDGKRCEGTKRGI